jgi:O-methyltransferase involved in polyketide biosynthesis
VPEFPCSVRRLHFENDYRYRFPVRVKRLRHQARWRSERNPVRDRMHAKYVARLAGVQETLLCALHNRAVEAQRPDTYLQDPDCVRIYQSIDYDFDRKFGRPRGAHPMRSRLFDLTLRPWLARHPGGTVVELGAGLETQFQRCDDGKVRWVCIDLPEAIALRKQVLPPNERCRYLSQNALDLSWMEAIDDMRGVFITGQGLLMYLKPAEVARLFTATAARFAELEWMFDTIPRWLSNLTLKEFRALADRCVHRSANALGSELRRSSRASAELESKCLGSACRDVRFSKKHVGPGARVPRASAAGS